MYSYMRDHFFLRKPYFHGNTGLVLDTPECVDVFKFYNDYKKYQKFNSLPAKVICSAQ
jgi:hypothetical protein